MNIEIVAFAIFGVLGVAMARLTYKKTKKDIKKHIEAQGGYINEIHWVPFRLSRDSWYWDKSYKFEFTYRDSQAKLRKGRAKSYIFGKLQIEDIKDLSV